VTLRRRRRSSFTQLGSGIATSARFFMVTDKSCVDVFTLKGFKTPVHPGNESFPATNQSFETPRREESTINDL
jgi:hypothetical protein